MNTKIKTVISIFFIMMIMGCGNVLGQVHNYGETIVDTKYAGEWVLMGMIKEGKENKQKEEARYNVRVIEGGYLATIQKTSERKESTLFFQIVKVNNQTFIQIPWDHGLNIVMKADFIGESEVQLAFLNTEKLKSQKVENTHNVQSNIIRTLIIDSKDIFDDTKLRIVKVDK